MSPDFDVAEEVNRGVRDRAGAWRFVQGFATHWVTPVTRGDGWHAEELAAAEDRLGLRLPAAVREAYGLFGRRADLTSNQDQLLSPDELKVDEAGEVMVFRVENQSVASWGVPLSELDTPDPSVVLRLDLAGRTARSWDAWLGWFSLACVEMVLSESLFSGEGVGDNREVTDHDTAVLAERYTRLPIPEYPVSQTGPGTRWYAGPDVVVRDDQRQWLWVRARTPEALDQARHDLPGEWELAGA